ncbi:hypothetical protein F4810DRAFT_678868 [Camillea tinctor]|nr:hypothetical protein F4810DRAFT_678868 [Camillea tinctor]
MAPRQPPGSTTQGQNKDHKKELPSGYTTIKDIHGQKVPVGSFANVIGLLKDFRAPIPTNRTDWKATLTLYDQSTLDYDSPASGLDIILFRPENEMPQPSAGDVVIVVAAKVQLYRSEVSLLSNRRMTKVYVYSASEIPKPPGSAKCALHLPQRSMDRVPDDKENEYVSWLFHTIEKDPVPTPTTFDMQVNQSRRVKDKFATLGSVRPGQFCDAIVQVLKEPFDLADIVTLWVSDYTENEDFYKFSWDATNEPAGRDGDPYGYVNTAIPAAKGWPGPYGRRSMQVTCFEPHASYIRSEVRAGQWVRLRNLQIKFGRNANNLEGFLREDRTSFSGQLSVDVLETNDPDTCDKNLKEAVRRKLDYEKARKKQKKSFAANNGVVSGAAKRKPEEDSETKNSRLRRKEAREALELKVKEQDKRAEARLGLNELVKCESHDEPVTLVSAIIEPVQWITNIDRQEVTLTLPFVCAKYRTNARVVDFRPYKLENFSSWRKTAEADLLSDYSEDSSSDSEDDEDRGTLNRYTGAKVWEWRFALQLEEVNPKAKGQLAKFWVVVDNTEAQLLTGLDACDLRAHPSELSALREQLFKLWGDLEELKTAELQLQLRNQKRLAANQPPPDSSPPNNNNLQPQEKKDNVSNKPFTCCVRQYGVKVHEPDPRKADAGEDKRWERVFALFGTKIAM